MEWDITTITAGDYTVEFKIPLEAFQKWKQDEYMAPGGPSEKGISHGLALTEHLSEEVERILNEWIQ